MEPTWITDVYWNEKIEFELIAYRKNYHNGRGRKKVGTLKTWASSLHLQKNHIFTGSSKGLDPFTHTVSPPWQLSGGFFWVERKLYQELWGTSTWLKAVMGKPCLSYVSCLSLYSFQMQRTMIWFVESTHLTVTLNYNSIIIKGPKHT